MDIDRYKQQHGEILASISALRNAARGGISENAGDMARMIVAMSSTIKLHLAMEDSTLYPALQRSGNQSVAQLGKRFQDDMKKIVAAYVEFSRKWNTGNRLAAEPETFRAEANSVLKTLFDRIQRENTDFYPAVEAL